MIRVSAIVIVIAVLLSGCVDGTSNFGAPPPVALATTHQELSIPWHPSRQSDQQLRRSIALLANGNPQAVRAGIFAGGDKQANAIRETLLRMGLDPAHITASNKPARHANGATIVLVRTDAMITDCSAAIAPAFPDDPMPSLFSLSRCTQDNNLAEMLVDPADLIASPPLGRADGAYLANGVRAWRGSAQTALPAQGTSGGAFSGGALSAPSATTFPSTSPAPPANNPPAQAQ